MGDKAPQIWFRWRNFGLLLLWWPVHWKGCAMILAVMFGWFAWAILLVVTHVLPAHPAVLFLPFIAYLITMLGIAWRHAKNDRDL